MPKATALAPVVPTSSPIITSPGGAAVIGPLRLRSLARGLRQPAVAQRRAVDLVKTRDNHVRASLGEQVGIVPAGDADPPHPTSLGCLPPRRCVLEDDCNLGFDAQL